GGWNWGGLGLDARGVQAQRRRKAADPPQPAAPFAEPPAGEEARAFHRAQGAVDGAEVARGECRYLAGPLNPADPAAGFPEEAADVSGRPRSPGRQRQGPPRATAPPGAPHAGAGAAHPPPPRFRPPPTPRAQRRAPPPPRR